MVYQKYGQVFKRIRLEHGFKISDFEKFGISKGTISNFENGKSMIGFDKLDMALQEMHTTLFAYSLLLNNEPDYFIIKFQEITDAYFINDLEKLKKIYKEALEYPEEETRMIGFSAKACVERLLSEERQEVENYLQNITVWTSYEFNIFINTMPHLRPSFIMNCLLGFERESKFYVGVGQYRALMMQALAKAVLIFVSRGERRDAHEILSKSEQFISEVYSTSRILLNFAEGYWIYTFENKKIGDKRMKKMLRILSDIGAYGLRNLFARYYRHIVKDKGIL